MERIKYIYKVSTYDSKKHTKSNTDVYYTKLEDCLWIYHNSYFNSKTDDLDERYYSHTPPPPPPQAVRVNPAKPANTVFFTFDLSFTLTPPLQWHPT